MFSQGSFLQGVLSGENFGKNFLSAWIKFSCKIFLWKNLDYVCTGDAVTPPFLCKKKVFVVYFNLLFKRSGLLDNTVVYY